MRIERIAATVAAALLAVGAARADYVVNIDFDTAPGGAPIASGDIVDSLYASLGVTFSADGPACGWVGGHAYASSNRYPADAGTLPNVVTNCGGGSGSDIAEDYQGSVSTQFAQDASQVCINVLLPADIAVLRIYDAQDGLLDTQLSNAGEGPLCASSATGIRSATFSGSTTHYARFDDLAVTFVPEPDFFDGACVAAALLVSRRARTSRSAPCRSPSGRRPRG